MKLFVLIFGCMMLIQDKEIENIYAFNETNDTGNWAIVDDRVMGGVSQGAIAVNGNGRGVYSGKVSTSNNGGFSSVRLRFKSRNVSQFNAVVLKIMGDRKNYQFRIKTSASQSYSYVHTFSTNGEWEEIRIPFEQFKPQYRGRVLNQPNFAGERMEEIAFLIGNKQNESFELKINSISLIK